MEETTTAMETEVEYEPNPNSNPNPKSNNRLGLKTSIQTNFGDDYVFQIVPKEDWSSMAVSLSTNVVKLYNPMNGHYQGECKGHTNTINQISFNSPNVLVSSSSDGTIRAWDTRSLTQVWCVSAGSDREIFSFSFGGSTNNLLAAGANSQILFWDWRNKTQVACLEESHTEDVTQVHFIPDHRDKLLSASVDGLMCIFDISGQIDDDDHLESVINVGTSIGKVGFLGESYQKLWCLTHIESLSIWDWTDASNKSNFPEARSLASESWALDQVDYFVDCNYPGQGKNLWVIGGTAAGTIGYFPVNYRAGVIEPPDAILGGGHTSVIRSVLPMSSKTSGPAQTQGVFGWTGGEDGRLCCWLSDDSPEINRSWISSELVMKSPKNCKKNRHHPY